VLNDDRQLKQSRSLGLKRAKAAPAAMESASNKKLAVEVGDSCTALLDGACRPLADGGDGQLSGIPFGKRAGRNVLRGRSPWRTFARTMPT
jgi:hypothetical protein